MFYKNVKKEQIFLEASIFQSTKPSNS